MHTTTLNPKLQMNMKKPNKTRDQTKIGSSSNGKFYVLLSVPPSPGIIPS